MPDQLRDQLILTIERTFQYSQEQAEKLYMELMLCVKKKELVRFKIHEQRHEKTQQCGFHTGVSQTRLSSHRRQLDAGIFGFRK